MVRTVLLLVMAALPQCAPHPFKSPSVVVGSDSTVSIEAGKAVEPHNFAQNYCAQYNKSAVYLGATTLSASDITRMYAYDCVSGHR